MIQSLAEASAKYIPMPVADKMRLVRQAQRGGSRGQAALQSLIHHDIRLIIKNVGRYSALRSPTVEYDDLLQVGLMAYQRAVELFDASRGNAFSTYVVSSIRRQVERHLDLHAHGIRVSVQLSRRIRQHYSTSAALMAATGREPTRAELRQATGLSDQQLDRITERPVVAFSLDDPLTDDGELDHASLIVASSTDETEAPDRQALLNFLENLLPPKHCKIFCLHFGLDPSAPEGLNQSAIAEKYGLTRERIRQILHHAETILRHPPNAAELKRILNLA